MRFFRKLAHLEEQLGDERFQMLLNPDNTGKVKKFCDELIESSLPTEMTVGDRTYEILRLLQEDEDSVGGRTMVDRAWRMDACPGEDDCKHILKYQDDIPVVLRGKRVFIFVGWYRSGSIERVAYVKWDDEKGRWVQDWFNLDYFKCVAYCRTLRRKKLAR